jgi:hypothetical protein
MCNVHGEGLVGPHWRSVVKAILEFNYPDDEVKLRRAIHCNEAFDTLWTIKNKVSKRFTHKADLEEVLKYVQEITDDALRISGEDV